MRGAATRRCLPVALACAVGALALAPPGAHAGAPAPAKPTVAVLYFDYDGPDPELGMLRKGLAQMLISDLAASDAVTLVERERLQSLLEEQELAKSHKLDPATATKIGKLLGARYMVLGSYFALMGTLRADARLVEVETGRVVHSVGTQGKPETFLELEAQLSGALSKALAERVLGPGAAEPAHPEGGSVDPERSKKRPKRPKRLAMKTAVRYAKALDAKDRGDKAEARKELEGVLAEQPDFQLAAVDLDRLMQ